MNLTASALATDPTLGKYFALLDEGLGPAAVAAIMAADGLDPGRQTDGTPAGDARGDYGGRPPLLDEASLERAMYEFDARTYRSKGTKPDGNPGVGGGIAGRAGGNGTARGVFWARLPPATARALHEKGDAEILLALMRTYPRPDLPVTPGAGLLRLTVRVGHGKVRLRTRARRMGL